VALIAVGVAFVVRSGFAMKEGDALDSLTPLAAMGRTVRLRSVGLQGAILSTPAAMAARSFRRLLRRLPRGMGAWCRPARAVLLRRGNLIAMARLSVRLSTAVFPRQGNADQPFDIA
jgi:hypothetical protein